MINRRSAHYEASLKPVVVLEGGEPFVAAPFAATLPSGWVRSHSAPYSSSISDSSSVVNAVGWSSDAS